MRTQMLWAVAIGLHVAPQPVVLDASLTYRCEPSEEGTHAMIDYERYCNRVSEFLTTKPHTRMLETLAVEIAQLSFDEWPALDALTVALYKPKIREGTRRIGVELDWTRADHDARRANSADHVVRRRGTRRCRTRSPPLHS